MSSRNRKGQCLKESEQCSCKQMLSPFFDHKLSKCSRCDPYVDEYFVKYGRKTEIRDKQSKSKCSFLCILIIGLILVGLSLFCYMHSIGVVSSQVLTPNYNLRSHFPSQKSETWQHIFSVLNMKFPTVKTVTLLYGKNDKTTECLVSKLIMMYTKDINIKIKDVSFENISQEVKDYGEVLEYYRPIVQKHGIFVTDLNKIPANIARIFHSLCDEVSSPIKPSLFIFILRNDENAQDLKPLRRATTILKEIWQDLPPNELSPLLSRVVKNVVDVIPEKLIKC